MEGNVKDIEEIARFERGSPRYWNIHGVSSPLEMNMNEVLW